MKRAFLALIALALIAGIGVAWTIYQRTSEPFKGYDAAEQFVAIEPGSATRTIGQRLIEAGVIRNDATFRAALWRSGRARSLQAGEFRFDRPMTPVEVIDKIARGDVYNRRITFPEGLNAREMARIYEQQGFGKASAFAEAAKDASAIRDIDSEAPDLEGYLFPETYSVPRDTTAAKLVALMVARFRQLFTADMQQAARQLALTPR
ncbi:MAG: endolytic transglycosylase MltG, partial [Vicinamibacterales bacterium]